MNINGIEIGPGESRQINLNIARLPTRTAIDIPINVYRAQEDGPCLLLLAGMHGNELTGVEIVRNLIASGRLTPKKGTIIAIPLFNIYAYLNLSRQVPDGKDVNRSFPGSSRGSLASRLAYHFVKEILPHVDVGVDFHTGSANINNYPQVRCLFKDKKSMKLARAFAPRFIVNAKLVDKSLRKEATKRGQSIIVYEGGESLRMQHRPVLAGIRGTLRLMKHLGMASKATKAPYSTIMIPKSRWIRSRYAGMFMPQVKNGSKVKEGEPLGTIRDPFGDFEWAITAPTAGYVYSINNKAVVNQGDALIHIGLQK